MVLNKIHTQPGLTTDSNMEALWWMDWACGTDSLYKKLWDIPKDQIKHI